MTREESTDQGPQFESPSVEDRELGWQFAKYLFPVALAWMTGILAGIALYTSASPMMQEILIQPARFATLEIPISYLGVGGGVMAPVLVLYFVYKDHDG